MNKELYRYLLWPPPNFCKVPWGSEKRRPKGIAGELYCNSTNKYLEVHNGIQWYKLQPYKDVSLSQSQFDKLALNRAANK